MKKCFSVLAFLFLSLSACQKDPSRTSTELESNINTSPTLVQAADGTLYSTACLKQNASQIQTGGTAAMSQCKMMVKFNSSSSTGQVARGKFFYNSSYAWILYPPTYWNTNQYSSYNYGSSSYNPYQDSSYNNNAFCSYVFGGNYNYNCYYLFGYTSQTNYSSSYNPTCNYCLYSYNQASCQSSCMRYSYFSIY